MTEDAAADNLKTIAPGDGEASEQRLAALEDELRDAKTQIQQIMLDIREHVLEFTNPFSAEAKLAVEKKAQEMAAKNKKRRS